MKNPLLKKVVKPKKNPLVSAEDLIARAYKDGLIDGKNHANKDSFYTKETPKELKLAYLNGYSKGKKENPAKKKNSTVRINPKSGPFAETYDNDNYHRGLYDGEHSIAPDMHDRKDTPYMKGYYQGMQKRPSKKQNPNRHYPRTPRGRPTKGYWWILDFYDTKEHRIGTSIGRGPKEEATREAKDWVGLKYKKKLVQKVLLSGPYDRKPTKQTVRV